MKIGVIGDVHVGNHARMGGPVTHGMNERCRRVVRVYENAVTAAINAGARQVVVLGDLFDNMHPTPQMVSAVRRVHAIAAENAARMVILKGNHDSNSGEPGDNAVTMLEEKHCVVVDVAQTVAVGDVGLQCLPFQAGVMVDWAPDALAKLDIDFEQNFLFCHAGIKTDSTAPWLASAPDGLTDQQFSDICNHYAMDLVFAGHWHEYQRIRSDPRLTQVGAICPTGFNNLGVDWYGKVVVVDTKADAGKVTVLGVPGPRFLQFSHADGLIEECLTDLPRANAYFIEYKAASAAAAATATKSAELARSAGILADFSVSFEDAEDMAEAQKAATEAAEVSGIPSAVAAYIENAVPKHMRQAVLARTLRYLSL